MNKDFVEILSSQFVAVTGGLLAGSMLAFFTNKLLLIPGLLVLIPGFLEMRGNISGSLSARLSSALHLGTLSPKSRNNKFLRSNILASWILVVLVSVILGIVAYLAILIFFKISEPRIIYVSFVAAIISNIIILPLTTNTTIWLFKKGYDPDDIMGPYNTSIGDITSVLSILVAIFIIT